jgi:hypothetical protein
VRLPTTRIRNDKPNPAPAHVNRVEDDSDDSEDGEDHAKEHLFQNEDLEDENEVEVFHDAEEELDEANTFFDGDAYADVVKHKAVK